MSAVLARSHRLFSVLTLGFASGLPLALTGQAMQAWLSADGVDLATIGFFALVGLPYTFKFLWAPLMDRFEPPLLGRRRGWLALTQLALALVLFVLAGLSPRDELPLFAAAALALAFLSASQDVVVDAWRTELLSREDERGLGASLHVFGYRLAMLVSGGLTLIWAEQWQSWPQVYRLLALVMAGLALYSLLAAPAVPSSSRALASDPRRELLGFVAMLAGAAIGAAAGHVLLQAAGIDADSRDKWQQLLRVLVQVALALPCAAWAARRAGFETLQRSLADYFALPGAAAFLLLIVLYKLGDAFAGSLTTPFLLLGMGFGQAEVGIANKLIGLWITVLGALLGGALMLRLSLYRALLLFGLLQLGSNAGFWLLARLGRGAWGGVTLPPFDWGFVALTHSAQLDWLLLGVIGVENLSGGMGTAAFVALLMSLCRQRFAATHYALLSALAAVGRIYVGPVSGVLAQSIGWPAFFLFSIVIGAPGVVMVWYMRARLRALTAGPVPADAD